MRARVWRARYAICGALEKMLRLITPLHVVSRRARVYESGAQRSRKDMKERAKDARREARKRRCFKARAQECAPRTPYALFMI